MDNNPSLTLTRKRLSMMQKTTDTYPPDVRSRVMRAIRSRNNKSTELFFIKLLKAFSIVGWRRHYPVKGKPDFVFLKQRIAVFLDGCFWHGHDCRNTNPKQNAEYWHKKINQNKIRDRRITIIFTNRGWTVFRIWECKLASEETIKLIKRISRTVADSHPEGC